MSAKISGYKKGESTAISYNQLKAAKMIMVLSGVCGRTVSLKECLDDVMKSDTQADSAMYGEESLHSHKKTRRRAAPIRTDKG